MAIELRQTPLHQLCKENGGRMVPFAGWDMPLQFSGLIDEHQAVRERAGMFDISHMGVLRLESSNPKDDLQKLVPSDLNRIGPGEACYTVLLNANGGILDDLIIYDLGQVDQDNQALLLVINAACSESDSAWLRTHLEPKGINITDEKADGILMAIQGPKATALLETMSGISLKGIPRFGHRQLKLSSIAELKNKSIFIGRTGYTGEDGFELLLDAESGRVLWQNLIEQGVTPCGLGARDTLRLEAAMPLYGQDLDQTRTPFDAGLGWLVHLEMPTDFIGREALEEQAKCGPTQKLVGLKVQGRGIARHNNPVMHAGSPIGIITSGSWSPTLSEAIALAYVPKALASPGTKLNVEIRGNAHPVEVVKRPFYRRSRS